MSIDLSLVSECDKVYLQSQFTPNEAITFSIILF